MKQILSKLYDLLDPGERKRAVIVFFVMLVTALLEVVGVASIMPFMQVASDPSIIQRNRILSFVYDWLGFQSTSSFLIFLGVVVLLLIVGSLSFKAFAFWVQVRYAYRRIHSIGCRVFSRYLGQPYEWFLNRHTSDISTTLLTEINRVVHGTLFPMMQLVAHGLVAVALLTFMVVIDPFLALTVAAVLGVAYSSVFLLVRKYVRRVGIERLRANRERFQSVQEAFGGVKDVKILGLENILLRRFQDPSWRMANKEIAGKVASEVPSFAMQGLVLGGMMLIALYLMTVHGSLKAALPVLAGYAFAGYRLMPALQAMYQQLTQLRYAVPSLEALHEDIISLRPIGATKRSRGIGADGELPQLRQGIVLRDVAYAYPKADVKALDGVNMEIEAFTTVGLVGSTGSGKTTAVDVILGLLEPSSGCLEVDGQPLRTPEDVRLWQSHIGYVPQSIYLSDDTVAGNIAFGLPPERIDYEAVERAARIANLHDFIVQEMPKGYDTTVGERGVRLSGGQRQRIGIARAMYRDPDVLVLDEATSALDNLTEKSVMDAIHKLGHQKTIIVIAHRLSTVKECDRLYMLDHGRIVGAGRYNDLLGSNEKFRALTAGHS